MTIERGYAFKPRWKEELVIESPTGRLVVEMTMGVPHVYFPTVSRWSEFVPDRSAEYPAILSALRAWCESQKLPLTIDEKAWVAAADAR